MQSINKINKEDEHAFLGIQMLQILVSHNLVVATDISQMRNLLVASIYKPTCLKATAYIQNLSTRATCCLEPISPLHNYTLQT